MLQESFVLGVVCDEDNNGRNNEDSSVTQTFSLTAKN